MNAIQASETSHTYSSMTMSTAPTISSISTSGSTRRGNGTPKCPISTMLAR